MGIFKPLTAFNWRENTYDVLHCGNVGLEPGVRGGLGNREYGCRMIFRQGDIKGLG